MATSHYVAVNYDRSSEHHGCGNCWRAYFVCDSATRRDILDNGLPVNDSLTSVGRNPDGSDRWAKSRSTMGVRAATAAERRAAHADPDPLMIDADGRVTEWPSAILLTTQIAVAVAAWMKRHGVTQSELSRRTGIPQPNISGMLAGKRWLGRDALDALARECRIVIRRKR